MKAKFLLLTVTTILGVTAKSQTQIFVANDGTKVDVNIISTNPDEGRSASIYQGMNSLEGVNFIGANYYKPTSYYLNAMVGPMGGMLDGSFFLFSNLKKSKVQQSIRSNFRSGSRMKNVVTVPVDKRQSIGIHAGSNYIDYSSFTENTGNNYRTNGLFGGVTFLSSKNAHWAIGDDKREAQRSSICRFNADVIFYKNRSLITTKNGLDPSGIDDLSRKVGFRIYMDGKTSLWSKNARTSLHYLLGVGRNSDKTKNLPIIAGLSFGYDFL